ncbi:formyltransferase family protein [Falsiroseomonas sp. HW251]|uniref:formyltransferase family protein n=1 Tax=Falsiroseomonas sp. HW251 TaxID=3390998 RepID=UPI003D320487
MSPLRIALLTLPSVMSDAASLAFARELGGRLVLLGLSDPMRPGAGGAVGQLRRHLARSGPRVLPYLALGFGLPRRSAFRRVAGARAVTIHDVNGATFRDALAEARPDLIVTLHFDQILAPETLAIPRLGGVNLHPSLLPRHRGPVPAFWALAEGGAEAGVSLHRLAARIDAGEILSQRRVALPAGVSALDASRRLHLAGLPLLRDLLARLEAGYAIAGTHPAILPYRGFPDAAALNAAARRGVRLVAPADLRLLIPGRATRPD